MTNCLFIRNIIALMDELNTKYLNPIPTNKEIIVKACVSKSASPLYNLESTLFVDNVLISETAARFMESSETGYC